MCTVCVCNVSCNVKYGINACIVLVNGLNLMYFGKMDVYVCVDMYVSPLISLFMHCVCNVFNVGRDCSVCVCNECNVYNVCNDLNICNACNELHVCNVCYLLRRSGKYIGYNFRDYIVFIIHPIFLIRCFQKHFIQIACREFDRLSYERCVYHFANNPSISKG